MNDADSDLRVILINGNTLAHHKVGHGVGVSAHETYVLKRLDSDYFEDA
jgi:restriction endonuclease Mrr